MVKFKGKEYQLKTLFIREEAALAKNLQRLADSDLEIQVDASIEVCHITTGIDKGDLNGSKMVEVTALLREIMAERAALRAAEEAKNAEKEAQETGKVEEKA